MTKLVVNRISISYTILICLGCAQLIHATIYTVGDENGWGPGNDYSKWVKGKNFFKGDILDFHYAEGYSVDEVNEENFEKCDATSSIFSANDGRTSITLRTSGVHYFIGGSFDECSQGMNLTTIVN